MDKLLTDCAIFQELMNKSLKENLIKSSLNGQSKLVSPHSRLKRTILKKDKTIQDFQPKLKNILDTQQSQDSGWFICSKLRIH